MPNITTNHAITYANSIYLPGVLGTGLLEIWSQVHDIAGNLLNYNFLKVEMLLVYK